MGNLPPVFYITILAVLIAIILQLLVNYNKNKKALSKRMDIYATMLNDYTEAIVMKSVMDHNKAHNLHDLNSFIKRDSQFYESTFLDVFLDGSFFSMCNYLSKKFPYTRLKDDLPELYSLRPITSGFEVFWFPPEEAKQRAQLIGKALMITTRKLNNFFYLIKYHKK